MLRTHQGGVASPEDEVPAIENEALVCGADENCRNPLREMKQQRDLLKDYFNHGGALAGQ